MNNIPKYLIINRQIFNDFNCCWKPIIDKKGNKNFDMNFECANEVQYCVIVTDGNEQVRHEIYCVIHVADVYPKFAMESKIFN